MHIPPETDRTQHNLRRNPAQRWADLEGKSDCMADDLVHEIEPALTTSQRLKLIVGWTVLVFCLFVLVLLVFGTLAKTPAKEKTPRSPGTPADNVPVHIMI